MPDKIRYNIAMNYQRLFVPNSLVFISVVTKYRKKILIDKIDSLRQSFRNAKQKYAFDIIAIIVNPDHFHMIIQPKDIQTYPGIIGYIKLTFTKISGIDYRVNDKREANVWQRRYWEHTIQTEEDLYKHIDYIHYNSMKHYHIAPQNWPYSSFKKFVNNGYYEATWCNEKDEHQIIDMELE